MKTVYFVRHAKSSWEDPRLRDIDRPLNKRGIRDAPFMASLLKEREQPQFDALISSPALRALTTAKYFGDLFMVKPRVEESIYEAWETTILMLIQSLDDQLQTVAIFGHNPTFTALANRFSQRFIDNVPTCGIFKVEANVPLWSSFSPTNAEMKAFYFPKQFK